MLIPKDSNLDKRVWKPRCYRYTKNQGLASRTRTLHLWGFNPARFHYAMSNNRCQSTLTGVGASRNIWLPVGQNLNALVVGVVLIKAHPGIRRPAFQRAALNYGLNVVLRWEL